MKQLPRSVPNWLRRELANCPQTRAGVHTCLFCMARQLHWHYDDKESLADVLGEAVVGCGRLVPQREIKAAVADSEPVAWKPDWALDALDDASANPRTNGR
jgi:hypothetical protein